jgi:DivIVA domain-containing protein
MSKRKRKGEDAEAVAETTGAPAEPGADTGRRLMPVDIQQKEFRLAFRGYNEHDVDQFLDMVTEELARLHEETKRLSERVEEGGPGPYGGAAPGVLIEDAQRRAEEIVREARDQASSILSQAGASVQAEIGATPGPSASPAEIRAFLAREREFLQGLAGLIQQHAEAVKRDAQAARQSATAAAAPGDGTPEEPEGSAEPMLSASASEPAGFTQPAPFAEPAAPSFPEEAASAPTSAEPASDDAWSAATDEPDPWSSAQQAPSASGVSPSTRVEEALRSLREGRISEPPDNPGDAEPSPAPAAGETQAWSNPFATRAAESPAEDEDEDEEEGDRPAPPTSLLGPAPSPAPASDPAPWPAPAPEPEPEPAPAPRREEPSATPRIVPADDPKDAAGREDDDRSLRELFWGEE